MILSDRSIKEGIADGRIVITPYDEALVQPASIDIRLDGRFLVFRNYKYSCIDPKSPQEGLTEMITVEADEPFIVHPGEFILGNTVERLKLGNDIVARLEGKALALETPIPTPVGWKTMADLKAGDWVFHPGGCPVPVVAATEVLWDRPCRRVVFSGGESLVADSAHQWSVFTKAGRSDELAGAPVIRTTEEISRNLRCGGDWNYQVALCRPVCYPEQTLPADPYVLGVRLGKGTCASPNKRVPREYLQSSVEQRLALLQGLMDSGGVSDEYGQCEFCSGSLALVEAVMELAASLGFYPWQGADCVAANRVAFTPDQPVFRLEHKRIRQAAHPGQNRFRAITAVDPVESVPVRCIEVGSPDGQYLAGRHFIRTHNSSLGRLGLIVHATAGYVDPGFDGNITLELSNVANLPIRLYPGMKVGQISFFAMSTPAERPYGHPTLGSKYKGQTVPTASRMHLNFNDTEDNPAR